MTRDCARFVAGKEQPNIRHVDGHARAYRHVHVLVHLPHHVGVERFGIGRHRHRRDDGAGVYGVTTNARARETHCRVFR